MIAQHAIMADFEGGYASLRPIFRLQRGNRPPTVARHTAQFVQRRVIAIGDIAAACRLGRRGRYQRAGKAVDQRAMAIERRQQLRQQQRLRRQATQPFAQQSRFAKAITQLTQVARTTPAQRHPAQRPANVWKRTQRATQLVAQACVVMEHFHKAQPRLDQCCVHQWRGQILRQQTRACARDGAIDSAEQAARTRAAHRCDDFQTFARRRVNCDMAAAGLAQRWGEEGQLPLTRMVEISDQPAHRGQLRPTELAKAIERRDAEQMFELILRTGAGKSGAIETMRVGQVKRCPFRHDRLAGAQPREFGGQVSSA